MVVNCHVVADNRAQVPCKNSMCSQRLSISPAQLEWFSVGKGLYPDPGVRCSFPLTSVIHVLVSCLSFKEETEVASNMICVLGASPLHSEREHPAVLQENALWS